MDRPGNGILASAGRKVLQAFGVARRLRAPGVGQPLAWSQGPSGQPSPRVGWSGPEPRKATTAEQGAKPAMSEQRTAAEKNVAARHHGEMAAEHDRQGHRLDEEHREPAMLAHKRETRELRREQQGRGKARATRQPQMAGPCGAAAAAVKASIASASDSPSRRAPSTPICNVSVGGCAGSGSGASVGRAR